MVEQPSHHPHFRTDGSVDSDASLSSSKACVLGLLTRPVPHFVHLNPVHLHVLHGVSAPGDVDFLPDGEIAGGAETLVGFTEPQHLPVSVDLCFVVLPLHTHQTPKLFSSIAEGNLPSVLECLSDGQCADVCDSSGLSALYTAVIREHPDIACALIRAKATHRRLHGATPGF